MVNTRWTFVHGTGWIESSHVSHEDDELRRRETRDRDATQLARMFVELERRIVGEPALQLQLARNVHAWSTLAGFDATPSPRRMKQDGDGGGGEGPHGGGHGSGTHAGGTSSGGTAQPASQPITVEAFWWGFHFVIPHDALQIITTTGDVVNTFVSLVGPETGPAAPFVELAAALVGKMLETMRNMDTGNGIYFSMTWLLPGVFVPTPV